jgi:DNA-directed RNA polymerase specialized sigma subunit
MISHSEITRVWREFSARPNPRNREREKETLRNIQIAEAYLFSGRKLIEIAREHGISRARVMQIITQTRKGLEKNNG